MKEQHPLVTLGFILGGSFLLAIGIVSFVLFRLKSGNDTVAVTGSAKVQVTSDQAKWTSQITRSVKQSELKSGYAKMAGDLALVKTYIASQGVTDAELTISPVAMNEIYQQDQAAEHRYNLVQTFTVQSTDVAKITTAANGVANVVNQGVIYSTNALEYYYLKLADARIQLLSQALSDAKVRATEMAKNSGRSVGVVKSVSSGVVQVQSLNSTDVSDYGSYDTSQVEKQITVSVKAVFALN